MTKNKDTDIDIIQIILLNALELQYLLIKRTKVKHL